MGEEVGEVSGRGGWVGAVVGVGERRGPVQVVMVDGN